MVVANTVGGASRADLVRLVMDEIDQRGYCRGVVSVAAAAGRIPIRGLRLAGTSGEQLPQPCRGAVLPEVRDATGMVEPLDGVRALSEWIQGHPNRARMAFDASIPIADDHLPTAVAMLKNIGVEATSPSAVQLAMSALGAVVRRTQPHQLAGRLALLGLGNGTPDM